MRTLLLKLSFVFTIVFALTASSPAQVQDHMPLRVTVPFDFIAGDIALPAGDYSVRPLFSDQELISGRNGHAMVAAPPVLDGKAGTRGLLIFHQIGDKYFLSEVWPAGSPKGRMINGKSASRRQIDAGLTSHVTVIAGGTR